jgi:serine/threonine protein kinase
MEIDSVEISPSDSMEGTQTLQTPKRVTLSRRDSVEDPEVFPLASTPLVFGTIRTPKTRRKSDIHELLPELIARNDSEGRPFTFIGPDRDISELYIIDAAFYSAGGKSVTRCTEIQTDRTFIMKRRTREGRGGESERRWCRIMERIIRLVHHPHIVSIHEICEDQNAFYVIMEECNGGQLLELLLNKNLMTQRECKGIIQQILSAVDHLHENGLIHRDIKPENIMFDTTHMGETIIKLIDFDTCEEIGSRRLSLAVNPSDRPLRKRSTTVVGTLGYIAPECFNGEYSFASDLYSIGVIMYILMTGDLPFDDDIYNSPPGSVEQSCMVEQLQIAGSPKSRRVQSKLTNLEIDWEVPPWSQLPMARDLCTRLLNPDPSERISSCTEALGHPWLSGVAIQTAPLTPSRSKIQYIPMNYIYL